ncbi:MAG: phosphatidate cytidylyltransferase [Desulfohalobiaceae bacterium]|nr:phosphatidate cytidylyltransferase [Desulfohalobiaceae bacterium]
MTSHQQRLLTASILLPLLALLVFQGSPLAWAFVLAGVSMLGLWEFYSLFWPRQKRALKLLGLIPALLLCFGRDLGLSPIGILLIGFWGVNCFFLLKLDRGLQGRWSEAQVLTAGWLYLPVVLHFVLYLQKIELILVLLVTFFSDTGAFYCGRLFGKKKIWPKISPNKTWAGALGSILASVPVCLLVGLFQGTAALYHWLWIPVLLAIGAQIGDFFESGLKRHLGVKDSGTILPGHGGLLDRIDSLLLVLPAYMAIRTAMPLF